MLGTARGASVDALDLAIIGMGKCGARELNYISDVDVVYVIAPVPASELPEGVEPLTSRTAPRSVLSWFMR